MSIRRFRLRTLLIATAAVAVALWAAMMWRRHESNQQLASYYAMKEWRIRRGLADMERLNRLAKELPYEAPFTNSDLAETRARADRCARLNREYARAARFPWLTVDPGPTPPWRRGIPH